MCTLSKDGRESIAFAVLCGLLQQNIIRDIAWPPESTGTVEFVNYAQYAIPVAATLSAPCPGTRVRHVLLAEAEDTFEVTFQLDTCGHWLLISSSDALAADVVQDRDPGDEVITTEYEYAMLVDGNH